MSGASRPIARLSRRVSLFAPVTIIDGHGLPAQGFAPAGEVWAALRPMGGRSDSEAGPGIVFSGYEAEIRAPHPVTAGWRMQAGTRNFRVRDVFPAPDTSEGPGGRLVLVLSEEVPVNG